MGRGGQQQSHLTVQQPGVIPEQAAQAGGSQQQPPLGGQQAGSLAPVVYNIDGVPEPAFVVDNSG